MRPRISIQGFVRPPVRPSVAQSSVRGSPQDKKIYASTFETYQRQKLVAYTEQENTTLEISLLHHLKPHISFRNQKIYKKLVRF